MIEQLEYVDDKLHLDLKIELIFVNHSNQIEINSVPKTNECPLSLKIK